MSTRSGKRIHSSMHENALDLEAPKSEVKTRTRCHKENEEIATEKHRRNYVRYPSEEDTIDKVNNNTEVRNTRKSKRNTLKERNILPSDSEVLSEVKQPVRQTRSTKLLVDSQTNGPIHEGHNKKKKGTKKHRNSKSTTSLENQIENNGPIKKKNKKKSKRKSDHNCVETVLLKSDEKSFNKSNMSIDSFHSAAGSPIKDLVKKSVEKEISDAILHVPISVNDNTAYDKELFSNNLRSSLRNSSVKKRKSTNTSFNLDLNESLAEEVVNNSLLNNSYGKRKPSADQIFDITITQHVYETNTEINGSENYNILKKKKLANKPVDITKTEFNNHVLMEPSVHYSSHTNSFSTEGSNLVKNTIEIFESKCCVQTASKKPVKDSPLKKSSQKNRESTNNTLNSEYDEQVAELSNVNNIFNSSLNRKRSTLELVNTKPVELSNQSDSSCTSIENKITTVDQLSSPSTRQPSDNESAINKETPLSIIKVGDFPMNTTFDKSCQDSFHETDNVQKNSTNNKYSLRNSIVDKNITISKDSDTLHTIGYDNVPVDQTLQKHSNGPEQYLNDTYDKKETTSEINTTFDKTSRLDTTFDKQVKDCTYDKIPTDNGSIVTSDSSNNLTFDKSSSDRISLTSDDSRSENIVNTTPVLIESSIDESTLEVTNLVSPKPTTPLKREGTFTKEGPEVLLSPKPKLSVERTPTRRNTLPSPGCTPFLSKSTTKDKTVFNITHSIEKSRRSSMADIAPRTTKVMFCSPVNNPALLTQLKRKVIKSNLKGSNKSFVIEDNNVTATTEVRLPTRKRSFTQSDADDVHAKRKRLAEDLEQSVARLSRPRTNSATAKLQDPGTPSKKATPKKEARVPRTRLPNFAALHQKQFSRMESLDECQRRRAKRARQLLTPRAGSLRETDQQPASVKKVETPVKVKQQDTNTGYTRFGFKLHLDGNPFNFSAKNTDIKPKETQPYALKRQATLPSLAGGTMSRRDAAKQAVMREKSFTDRDLKRKETRTVIKGVRTNRRFELQMKMRNIV